MKSFFFARDFLSREISGFSAGVCAAIAVATLAGCGSGSTATPPSSAVAAGGNTIQLSVSNAQIPSAGNTSITVSATLLSAGGQVVAGTALALTKAAGETVSFSAVSGAVTDVNGKVTATLSNLVNKTNRTVIVTATAGSATATIPVLITGSTVTASSTASTLPDDSTSPATLTITAKDSAGTPIAGTPVTFTTSGTGAVTVTAAAATTDVNGKVTATVAGTTVGAPIVTATASGATAAANYTVTATGATFSIDQTTLTTGGVAQPPTANPTTVSMKIGDSLVVRAGAPTSATVTFATTLGTFGAVAPAAPIRIVPGVAVVPLGAGGKASVTLRSDQAGIATVQAFDPATPSNSSSITVAITSVIANANAVTIQASPTVVAKSVGTTTGVSTLTAKVTDAAGQPVGGAPVAFSIVTGTGTGGGETITPVVAFTASTTGGGLALGEARATFTSGSISSGQQGVKIRASVIGAPATIETATNPSGPDAAVVIGGTAGSVAFGTATVLAESTNGANYIQSMSVLVADPNGNPAPAGTVVNLSAWPIAWSTGTGCFPDTNTNGTVAAAGPPVVLDTPPRGTFFNEDVNENLTLDAAEDGRRFFYPSNIAVAPAVPALGTATTDGFATPPSSAAGLVPGTVTTDANGVATFDLVYGKSNALWIVTRLRARTTVLGTEAVSEIQFRLAASENDVKLPTTCRLPNSPYFY